MKKKIKQYKKKGLQENKKWLLSEVNKKFIPMIHIASAVLSKRKKKKWP